MVICSRHIHDVLAEEALVLAFEGLGRVPVEDGDEWLQPYHEIIFNYYGFILMIYTHGNIILHPPSVISKNNCQNTELKFIKLLNIIYHISELLNTV